MTRRELLAAATAAMAIDIEAATGMPVRKLGGTGQKVSLLAFGCGSRWLSFRDRDKGLAALERALKAGVNYVDNANNYGRGRAEQWVGEYLKTHKKDFFLVTKILGDRTYDGTMRDIEQSFKNLGVDRVDLMHIHGLAEEDDLAKIEAPNGQLKAMYRAKEQKLTRFVGITSHQNPVVLKTALERHDFDSTQMPLNIVQIGGSGPSYYAGKGLTGASGFEALALPVALKKKMGVTAMKVFAQDRLLPQASPEMLLRYAMSLPVAAAVVGMSTFEQVDFNVSVAKSFKPLSPEEMKSLPAGVTERMRASIDRFFASHEDC